MAGGNGAYEPIPDSENGIPPANGSGKKWLLSAVVVAAVAATVYGAKTFLGSDNKTASSIESLLKHSSTLHVNAEGKLKLFDDLSK